MITTGLSSVNFPGHVDQPRLRDVFRRDAEEAKRDRNAAWEAADRLEAEARLAEAQAKLQLLEEGMPVDWASVALVTLHRNQVLEEKQAALEGEMQRLKADLKEAFAALAKRGAA